MFNVQEIVNMRSTFQRSLSLVQNQSPKLNNSESAADILNSEFLKLFQSKLDGDVSVSNIVKFVSLINKARPQNTVVQLSHDVEIDLLDDRGNGYVCFKYDLANYGIESLDNRGHRFWFTNPQTDLEFAISTASGKKLEFEYGENSETRKEITVYFNPPLEASERFKYQIMYPIKNGFTGNYYDIVARSITHKISFSVKSPPNMRFDKKKVVREGVEGFIDKSCPLLSCSIEEDGREKLYWQLRHPKLGDRFRTHWSFA